MLVNLAPVTYQWQIFVSTCALNLSESLSAVLAAMLFMWFLSLDESDEDFHLMTMENKVYSETTPSTSMPDDLTSSTNSDTRSECTSKCIKIFYRSDGEGYICINLKFFEV